MKATLIGLTASVLIEGFGLTGASGQTAGTARMEVTIKDYVGRSGTAHWTVAWVTTESGGFIKSLRKQGPSFTASDWANHCGTWNTARAGSAALDGYTSATAADYTGINSPVIQEWNCRDANNNLMPDGNYKFWVQYAENSGQGPVTTTGLLWRKGPSGSTNTYPDQGANFASMKVTWIPVPSAIAPAITSAAPTATATVGVPYHFTCTATGTAPITFSASDLPTGLSMSSSGIISGTPDAPGSFSGTIIAANGTPPNATQAFTIIVGVVPVSMAAPVLSGGSLVLSGQGPANGTYAVLTSTDVAAPAGQWTALATNSFDVAGQFRFTNSINLAVPRQFYRIRVP